jgi:opacity protein-like surface antigen
MKKGFLLTVAASVLSASAVAAHAERPFISVDVPFEFHFGRQTLPAGRYSVVRVGHGGYDLQLTGSDGKRSMALVECNLTGNGASKPKLIFHRIGGTYFLFQAWGADGQGTELPLTREEQELSRRAEKTELALSAN